LAERRRRAYNASLSDGRDRFRCRRLDLSQERPRRSSRVPLRPRRTWSRDGRQRVASPTCSQGAGSLIETSTTTAKTCRPNRGRSIHPSGLPLARAPGMEPAALRLSPELRTPPSPAAHVEGGDRPSSTDLELPLNSHPSISNPVVHSMRATSPRTVNGRGVAIGGLRPAFVPLSAEAPPARATARTASPRA